MWYYPLRKSDMDYKYILIANKEFKFEVYLNKFIELSKVEQGQYGETLMERFFKAIAYNLIDLKREYNRYYKKEYETLQLFLYNKYLFSKDNIQLIDKFCTKDIDTIFYGNLTWNVDYNLAELLVRDTKIVDKINYILGRIENED